MKIEKVENGYIVEVEIETPETWTASDALEFGTERYICNDLTKLLDFINAHYGKELKYKPNTIVEIN